MGKDEDDYSVEFWDKYIEIERRIFGKHWPGMTYTMFTKMATFEMNLKNKNQRMTAALTKQWMDLAEEVEKELMITHGKEHWDYEMIANVVRQVKLKIGSFKF